jgi:hypothetical protein
MAEQSLLSSRDALRTYRYLRIGMVGAVILLGTSIAIERSKDAVECWQTSISAYYYTPVRAIFVGALFAVGLALIVIKGKSPVEDACLNVAGMLAPLVAVAPTTDVGKCWSVPPHPLPVEPDDSLAKWVITNIDNNVQALLIAGVLGLAIGLLMVIVINRSIRAPVENVERGTRYSLLAAAAILGLAWLLYEVWDDFNTRAHGFAALLMFLFLIGAVSSKAVEYRDDRRSFYFWAYAVIALAMIVSGLVLWIFRIGDEHVVFVLEATEIALFAVFWLVQTAENWDESVAGAKRAS